MPNKSLTEYADDARYHPQLPPPQGWLSAFDAGVRLGVSAITIRGMVLNNVLEKGYIGKNLFVSVASIEQYEKTRKKPGYPAGRPRKKLDDK